MVVVDEGQTGASNMFSTKGSFANLLEGTVLLVVKQLDLEFRKQDEVFEPVVVVIARNARGHARLLSKPGLGGYVLKLPVAQVVIKSCTQIGDRIREKDIHLAVPVVIKKACTGALECLRVARCRRCVGQPRLRRHIHKLYLDLRWRLQLGLRRLYGSRVLALLAVGEA